MIDQHHNFRANPFKQQLLLLCANSQFNQDDLNAFLAVLSDQPAQKQNNILLIAAAIVQILQQKPKQLMTQTVALHFLLYMLSLVLDSQIWGQIGAGILLRNPNMNNLIHNILTQSPQQNSMKKQLNSIFKKVLSKDFIATLSKSALQNIVSFSVQGGLGKIRLLISLCSYLVLIPPSSDQVTEGQMLKNIQQCCRSLIKQKAIYFSKQQFDICLDLCVEMHKLQQPPGNQGYQLIWLAIIKMFNQPKLDKKLLSLSCLDTLLLHLKRQSVPNPISAFDISAFLSLIMDPQSHQQIINRSINFLSFWLQNTDQKQNLDSILHTWLDQLILKSDSRTSNIFGNAWERVILMVEELTTIQIAALYKNALNIYARFALNPQVSVKVMKVLNPLINKQFQPLERHEQTTLRFLKQIWQMCLKQSTNIKQQLDFSIFECIKAAISPKFNLFVLQEIINYLNNLINAYKLNQDDSNLCQVEAQVTWAYSIINHFLQSLSGNQQDKSIVNDGLQKLKKQMKSTGLKFLKQQQFLSNLIICHSSTNKNQLKYLLSLMSLLIKIVNDQQFEAEQLKLVSRKVDNSDVYYITWMRDRIGSIKNYNFKQEIMKSMFEKAKIYEGISQEGLKVLLTVLLHFDCDYKLKHMFAFSLLHEIDQTKFGQSVNLIIQSMWSISAIVQQKWLQQLWLFVNELKFRDEQVLIIYSEIIRIVESISVNVDMSQSDRILSQNSALGQIVQIKVSVSGQNYVQKVIKCNDNIPLWRFKIQSVFDSASINNCWNPHLDVLGIEYNSQAINQCDLHLSLHKLSSKYLSSAKEPGSPKIHLAFKMGNRNYALLKKIKSGALYQAITKYGGGLHAITIPVIKICVKNQLKNLIKLFVDITGRSSENLEEILKEELFYTIYKAIEKLIKAEANKNTNILINQLAQFLNEMKIGNELMPNMQCSHRKNISKQEFLINKSLSLITNEGNCKARIAYEFIIMLKNSEILSKKIIESDSWIKSKVQQKPYLISLAMDMQWLALKDKRNSFLLQNVKFNRSFEKVAECAYYFNNSVSRLAEADLRQILVRISVSGIKIFNYFFGLAVIQYSEWHNFFVTRQPKDVLSLIETKRNLLDLSSHENKDRLINQDPQAKQLFELAQHQKKVNIQISIDFIKKAIQGILKLVENERSEEEKANIFTLLYQTSRLLSWLCLLQRDVHQDMINLLVRKLKSQKSYLAKICISLLYILLQVDSKVNSVKILRAIFQNFRTNYSGFYDLFIECYQNCEQFQFTSSMNEILIQFLVDVQAQKIGAKNQQISSLLTILSKIYFSMNDNQCQAILQIMAEKYLFFSNDQIKATHPLTRLAVYESIESYLNKNSAQQNQNLYKRIVDEIKIANSQGEGMRNMQVGVGLRNLGNLCYMNSLLQLLNSIKPFVTKVCSIKSQFPLLGGLQNLFRSLSFSKKKSISPEQFVLCFDPPIDVGLQEDTTQFFINFLDKLEQGETEGIFKKITKDLFKGETTSYFKCSKCNNLKQKIQQFYMYNLAIENESKSFDNLEQCLQNAKIPEVIHDVNCEKCRSPQKFTKSTKLKTIPNYFFIQLRRLVFDYQNPYVKAKIHSRLQFPDEIIINGEKLLLKGVITHSGTGEHGHYYTSVKAQTKEADWIVYNDSKVGLLPLDGKEEHWYGSKQMGDYSTNAYVLLYSKDNIKNSDGAIQFSATDKIQKQNKSVIIKQLLFGKDYKNDFINFAFNVARLPNIGEPLRKVYEMLALISFSQGQATKVPPQQYFSAIKEKSTNMEALLEIVFEYKQHNNLFLFHKNTQLRSFFCAFLKKVFEQSSKQMSQGKCKLALVYACELVCNCVGQFKDSQNFINSGDYLQLIGFLIRQFSNNGQFLSRLYEVQFIQEVMKFFSTRKNQIEMNYNTTQIKLMEPLLEVLISFLNILNGQQSSVIFKFNEYQESAIFMRKFLLQEEGLVELMFMANSNYEYASLLFQTLEMQNDISFGAQLQNVARIYLSNYKSIDVNASKNYCYLLWYIQNHFYSQPNQKLSYCRILFGMMFPSSHLQSPLQSLKERTYQYLTTSLHNGYLEIVSQLLQQCSEETILKIGDLKILIHFIQLLFQFFKSNPVYIEYFSNLCSPIPIYCDYYTFLKGCLEEFIKKIELGLIQGLTRKMLENQKTQIRNIIHNLRSFFEETKIQSDPLLCGSIVSQPGHIMNKLIDSLFVSVEDHQNYWAGYNQRGDFTLLQYVDEKYCLKDEYSKEKELTKVLKPIQSETIDQQGSESTYKTKYQMQMQEIISCVERGWIRRKFIFTNTAEDQIQYKILIMGHNLKNKHIELVLNLKPAQWQEIFVQKIKLREPWGQIKIVVNGVEQILGETESMQSMSMWKLSEDMSRSDEMM